MWSSIHEASHALAVVLFKGRLTLFVPQWSYRRDMLNGAQWVAPRVAWGKDMSKLGTVLTHLAPRFADAMGIMAGLAVDHWGVRVFCAGALIDNLWALLTTRADLIGLGELIGGRGVARLLYLIILAAAIGSGWWIGAGLGNSLLS